MVGNKRIFLSYGHDSNKPLVDSIKAELETLGHRIWIDHEMINHTDDWRREITKGILDSNVMLSILSKYSMRDPGVCLDEVGIAIACKQGAIATVLVEPEQEVCTPPHVSSRQWLDMSQWKSYWDFDKNNWISIEGPEEKESKDGAKWFRDNMEKIVSAIEKNQEFSGELQILKSRLRPLPLSGKSSDLLRRRFVGREWLLQRIDVWRAQEQDQCVFWLTAEAGMGKSAIAARLSHMAKGFTVGVHFCEYDKPGSRTQQGLIFSLAYQFAARMPHYRSLLLDALGELEKSLESYSPDELFERLLILPLNHCVDGGQERYLVIIDALDEAEPALIDLFARQLGLLPRWLAVVLTSRPERQILGKLSHFPRTELNLDDAANESDLSQYVDFWFDQLESRGFVFADRDLSRARLLRGSEGNILYLVHAEEAQMRGSFDLNSPLGYPRGLSGIYHQWFQRQFGSEPTESDGWKMAHPLLEIVLASPMPVPLEYISEWLHWKGQDSVLVSRPLGSLLRRESGEISLCHRSLSEWLADEDMADLFFVNVAAAMQRFIGLLLPLLPESLKQKSISYNERALIRLLPKIKSSEYRLYFSGENVALLVRLVDKLRFSVNDMADARFAIRSVFEIHRSVLGERHSETLHMMGEYANTILGYDSCKALEIHESILEIRRQDFGGENVETLKAMSELAYAYSVADHDHNRAKDFMARAIAVQREVLGGDHAITQGSIRQLDFWRYVDGEIGDIQADLDDQQKSVDDYLNSLRKRALSAPSIDDRSSALAELDFIAEQQSVLMEHEDALITQRIRADLAARK